MRLSDFIRLEARAARSVNLERDRELVDLIKGYQVTARALEVLGRFADALEGERVSAWSLTGPYGMGKSAFVNYLLALTGPADPPVTRAARQKLWAADPGLFARLVPYLDREARQEGGRGEAVQGGTGGRGPLGGEEGKGRPGKPARGGREEDNEEQPGRVGKGEEGSSQPGRGRVEGAVPGEAGPGEGGSAVPGGSGRSARQGAARTPWPPPGAGEKGFFQVPVTASYEPLDYTLARGLLQALEGQSLAGRERWIRYLYSYVLPGAPGTPGSPTAPGSTPGSPGTPESTGSFGSPGMPVSPGSPGTSAGPGSTAFPGKSAGPGSRGKSASPGSTASPGTSAGPGSTASPGIGDPKDDPGPAGLTVSPAPTPYPRSRAIFAVIQEINRETGCPVIMVVDEFGKNLEFMSHHPGQGDIFTLQKLAESGFVYLWVCLHQAFAEYASWWSSLQREEWSKIQGRFEDISFVESAAQMLALAGGVLKKRLPVYSPGQGVEGIEGKGGIEGLGGKGSKEGIGGKGSKEGVGGKGSKEGVGGKGSKEGINGIGSIESIASKASKASIENIESIGSIVSIEGIGGDGPAGVTVDGARRFIEWVQRADCFYQETVLPAYPGLAAPPFSPGPPAGGKVSFSATLYPLHPLTALALVELCRRFAQHDRTLLAFLAGGNPRALPAYLAGTEIIPGEPWPSLGLDYLYDYFLNLGDAGGNRAESQRWIEIQDLVQGAGPRPPREKAILKTIGVLNLLSTSLGIRAGGAVIQEILETTRDYSPAQVQESLEEMVRGGVLLYREYSGEYRLWEGSDYDLAGALREKKARLTIASLEAVLEKFLPLNPVTASRHAYKTGTLRRFQRRWLDLDAPGEDLEGLAPSRGFDGLFLYSFGTGPSPPTLPGECRDGRPLLVAYVPRRGALQEVALETAALGVLLEESPELARDSVARKEARFRLRTAEAQFQQYLARLFTPGGEEVQWYARGERLALAGPRDLSYYLSHLCDQYYKSCPYIGNEMISYEKLSSAAARARRELVEAMANRPGEEGLGLKGFGPEVAVYRSLLRAEGLHCKDPETGRWGFSLPGKDPGLGQLWDKIDSCLQGAGPRGITADHLLEQLQAPPFGLRQGPAPLYICLYILARPDQVAVFQEGAYRPYLGGSDLALLLKRPDLFSLKKIVTTPGEQKVFDVYQGILRTTPLGDYNPGLRNPTLLGVVGPLLKFLEKLPAYTRQTREISPGARQVRQVIQNSTEPLKLLFTDLPRAVGLELNLAPREGGAVTRTQLSPGPLEQLGERLKEALNELSGAYDRLQQKVEDTILETFSSQDLTLLPRELRERVRPLVDLCQDPEQGPLLKALAREHGDPVRWLRATAGAVTKKPLENWQDQDFSFFKVKLRETAAHIQKLEILNSASAPGGEEGTVVSLVGPGGQVRQLAIRPPREPGPTLEQKIQDLLALPREQRQAILLALVKEQLGDEQTGDTQPGDGS